jgi:hypothetical protein
MQPFLHAETGTRRVPRPSIEKETMSMLYERFGPHDAVSGMTLVSTLAVLACVLMAMAVMAYRTRKLKD